LASLRDAIGTVWGVPKLLRLSAIIAMVATIAGVAFTSQGFDVQDVTLNNRTVWILQTGEGQRYGQVNTSLMELTSANSAEAPKSLVQSKSGVLLYVSGGTRYSAVNTAQPIDYTKDELNTQTKALKDPLSTDIGRNSVVYVGKDGNLFVSLLVAGSASEPIDIGKPDETKPDQKFQAATVAIDGTIYAFSKDDGTIRQYNPLVESWTNYVEQVPQVSGSVFQLAVVGDRWVLLDPQSGNIWIRGKGSPVSSPAGGELQFSSENSKIAYVSLPNGLITVPLEGDGTFEQAFTQFSIDRLTTRPVALGDEVFATWMDQESGAMFSSKSGEPTELDFNGRLLKSAPVPTIQSNGQTAVINESFSGWAWRLPDGALIKSTQNWALVDKVPDQTSNNAQVTKVNTPKAPVAENDNFGVRSGQLVSLPVLINDHDANNDILSILPESIQGLSAGFGSVRVSNNQQMLVVDMKAGATGSGSFTYKVIDGTGTAASRSATVSLRVVAPEKNSAPVWCTDADSTCLQEWPRPQVEPGGEVVVPVLNGWVDPEGDRIFVSGAEVPEGKGNVGFTASGEIVYQNDSPSATSQSTVPVTVRVSDVNGKESIKQLTILVNPEPVLTLTPFVVATATKESKLVDIRDHVFGQSGDVMIASIKPQTNSDILNIEQVDNYTFRVSGSEPSETVVRLGINDDVGEVNSFMRINIVEGDGETISSPPVTILVSPGLDSSVDLLAAVHNPTGRALIVSNVKSTPVTNGALFADLIKGGNLRVRGKTPQDTPGLIGVVNYTVSDGSGNSKFSADGQAFVYEMPQANNIPPVGISDSITVRVGQTAEIDVLANDVGNPGVPLAIDSKSFKQDCIKDGLIFAGSGKVRIVAPPVPGNFLCSYSIYASGNSTNKGVASLRISVVSEESNQAPRPLELSGRVRSGQTITIPVPLAGVDPDGDNVSVLTVSGANPEKGFVSLSEDRTGIVYSSVPGGKGQDEFTYVLVDSKGLASEPTKVKVAVLDSDPEFAPVTMVDYAEVIAGSNNKVVIDPLSNDYDPQPRSDSPLRLVEGSVVPDAAKESTNYKAWSAALTNIDLKTNKVTILAGTTPTTMKFVYTVTNSSGSTSDGQITIRVSKNAIDYSPEVTDTFVTTAELQNILTGIDVVNRKVSWPTGDVSKLTLTIWGTDQGFAVTGGTKLSAAAVPKDPTRIVFKLSGLDFSGNEVEGYGFLHLPGSNPMITLDPDKARQEVKENSSVDFKIDELVSLPGQIDVKSANALGSRDNAKCESKGNGSITYTAGAGGPWRDGCAIELRVKGSENYSTVLVPITVIPENPEPELQRRQLTIIPGPSGAIDFDLKSITTWVDHSQSDIDGLKYSATGGSDLFKITQNGSVLNLQAFGNSPSGSVREIKITITNRDKAEPQNLTLVVGQALNTAPVGGTLLLDCKVNEGQEECRVTKDTMNSAAGTSNAYSDTALVFAPFGYNNGIPNYEASTNVLRCSGGVSLRASSDSIYAVWSKSKLPSSVTCTGRYQVLDREDRLGFGVIEFTLAGVPGSVRGVSQVGYTASSIKIEVIPPLVSDPPVEGFNIYDEAGKDYGSCDIASDGGATDCWITNQDPYNGSNPEAKHTFKIFAFNSMGESSFSQELRDAYAYRAPRAITSDVFVSVVPVFSPKTTEAVGVANVTIRPISDSNVGSYELAGEGGDKVSKTITDSSTFTLEVKAKPGERSKITARAIGKVPPPGKTKNLESSSASWTGRIIGSPSVRSVKAETFKSGNTWYSRIVATGVNRNFSDKTANVAFILYTGSVQPTCNWGAASNTLTVTTTPAMKAIVQSETDNNVDQQVAEISSRDLSPILENTTYKPMVCFTNGFGKIQKSGDPVSTLGDPADGVYKYAVAANPTAGAWLVTVVTKDNRSGVFPEFNGSKNDNSDGAWKKAIYSEYFGEKSVIRVRYCLDSAPKTCSTGDRIVKAADSSRTFQMKVTSAHLTDQEGSKITVCSKGVNLFFGVDGSGLVSSSGSKLWQGDDPSSSASAPQYSTDNGVTWEDVGLYGNNYRIPRTAGTVNKIRLYVKGSDTGAQGVRGLSGEAAVVFSCQ
jgi:hypothetical protein